MLNLLKRDFKLSFGTTVLFFYLAFVPLFQFLMGNMIGPINTFLSIVLTYTMTTVSFGFDAKNSSHILFRSLALKPWEIAISKYILLFINFVLVNAYIFIATNLMSYFNLVEFNLESLNIDITIYTLMVIMISFSISLPIIFFSTPKVGEFISRLAMFITLFRGSFALYIGRDINTQLLSTFIRAKFILLVFVGMLVSVALSTYIIKEKEYRG